MRVAVVCLGYLGNPAGISLLAEYFGGLDADLYVHIDARIDIAPYATLPSIHSNVTLVDTRHSVYWAGFSVVRASVAGIEAARSARGDYTHFFVLSEDTIPLRSRAELWSRLASSEEFISSRTGLPFRERYEGFYYPDSNATSMRGLNMEVRAFAGDDMDTLRRLVALHERGKAPVITVWHGSGWWGLSTPHVERFLASYYGDPWLRQSFEFSLVPDEQYYHTVLGEVPNSTGHAVFVDFSRPFVYRTADEILAENTGSHPFLRKVPLGEPSIAEFVRSLT